MDLQKLIRENEQAELAVAKTNEAHLNAKKRKADLKQQLQKAFSQERKKVETHCEEQLAQIDADEVSKRQKVEHDTQDEIERITAESNAEIEKIEKECELKRQEANQRLIEQIKQFSF